MKEVFLIESMIDKNTLSRLSNSSFLAQKHHLNKIYPDVWNMGFVEIKGNEGDEGLLTS